MKTLILCTFAVFFIGHSFAQVGALTLNRRDAIYYGQWFTLKSNKNQLFLIDDKNLADEALIRLLLPYDLSIEDGEIDKDGDLFWEIESNNGFMSKIFRINNFENKVMVVISTSIIPEKEEFGAWHEKITRRIGYLF
jgi:hypothetical protein